MRRPVRHEHFNRNAAQRRRMRRLQKNGRGAARFPRLAPPVHAKAPAIARPQSCKGKARPGRDQVIAARIAELQEVGRQDGANRMAAKVHWPGFAASIAEVSRQRIMAAIGQRGAEDIERRHVAVSPMGRSGFDVAIASTFR